MPDQLRVSWSAVSERLLKARHYWLVTVGLRGMPHVIPVDAAWHDDRLYFASSPRTATARNIVRDPRVVVHLEDKRGVDLAGERRPQDGDPLAV